MFLFDKPSSRLAQMTIPLLTSLAVLGRYPKASSAMMRRISASVKPWPDPRGFCRFLRSLSMVVKYNPNLLLANSDVRQWRKRCRG
jgi:hypothetical protein